MKPLHAIAEDLRRVGVALIIAGLVGSFLQDQVPALAALAGIVIGIVSNLVGYWLHSKEESE